MKLREIYENTYSNDIDIKYLKDGNIKKLSSDSGGFALQTKIVNNQKFRFKIKNHCGHIQLGDNSYFIVPKMGKDFLHTTLKACGLPYSKYFNNKLKMHDSREFFGEFIAWIFIGAYERSLKGNIRNGYLQKTIQTYTSSGKILIERSKMFFQYSSPPPNWKKFEWSKNTNLNRAIRSLFLYLANNLEIGNKTKSKLLNIASEIADENILVHTDFQDLLQGLDHLHEAYRTLLTLAVSFNLKGIEAGNNKSFSLLIPTWRLFEEACKNIIHQHLPSYKMNIHESFSVKATLRGPNRLKPDVVIKNANNICFFVGDCKYAENKKLELHRDHFFQVNTYMDGYGLKKSLILYPTSNSYAQKTYSMAWNPEVKIYVFNIPTGNYEDFVNGLNKVAKLIARENRFFYAVKSVA